ncbi:hypothetical protein CHLV4142_08125 [Campylobacter helveticus]|uniref:Uncharacterized protein n=1 Tax=Campylobacter helveticus TaxID=28898 RepID=A0ABY3KYU3_9BACT|nr:hypothetical protein [Campylobacter helveticus]MCR2040107.1 hypothetical protein [Campylobacter helveticus]TXK53726.1 hypothetical protein FVD16_09860 [Campylobacter helveticus]
MMNIFNTNHRFHKCMPKECHEMYDTLKLMEKQDEREKQEEKVQLKSSNEKQEEYAIDSQSGFSILA